MDIVDDSSLMAYLGQVPDPRGRRGRQFEWWYLLGVVAAAVGAGESGVRAIAAWAEDHEAELVAHFQPACGRAPSLATVERTLWRVDRGALEQAVAAHARQGVSPAEDELVGVALDGKELRGVGPHGASVCLVSLTCHGSGLVLGQVAVPDKTNEITAAPWLVSELDLPRWVLTVDALHCQRLLAELVCARRGYYIMGVKANQPTLFDALVELFATPANRRFAPVEDCCESQELSHGRWEERRLETSTLLNAYLDWPGVAQVLRRHCRRTLRPSGKVEQKTTYFITNLPPQRADAERLAALIRGHWTIENKVHHVRDVSYREDLVSARTGSAAQALAALRNGVLNALRLAGVVGMARALRRNGAYVANALACIGVA